MKLNRREFLKTLASVAVALGVKVPLEGVDRWPEIDTDDVADTTADGIIFGKNGKLSFQPNGETEWYHLEGVERIEVPDPKSYGQFVTVAWVGDHILQTGEQANEH